MRWQPQYDTSVLESSILVTGSWDDERNSVVVWSGAGVAGGGEAGVQGEYEVGESVTGLEWLGQDSLLVTTSAGWLGLVKVGGLQGLHLSQEWSNLHMRGSGGCTALALHADNVATGGQEGKINILVTSNRSPVKVSGQ